MSPIALRHRLEATLFSGARRSLRLLGPAGAVRLGRILGRAWQLADRRRARVTEGNLANALPGVDADARRALARRSFEEYGASVFFTLNLAQLEPGEFARRVRWEGWERFEEAESEGKGVAFLSAHFGLFEACAWALGTRRPPIHAIARTLANPEFDAGLSMLRRRHGVEPVPRQGGMRTLLKVLRSGGRIGFVMDQRMAPEHALEIPFFGRRTFLGHGLALLSTASGAPVVPVFARRDGDGLRVRVLPPIRPPGDAPSDVEACTKAYAQAMEAEIRTAPELWTWQHRLWRAEDEHVRASSSVARRLAAERGLGRDD